MWQFAVGTSEGEEAEREALTQMLGWMVNTSADCQKFIESFNIKSM